MKIKYFYPEIGGGRGTPVNYGQDTSYSPKRIISAA
jgi:hypothetical protein